MKSEWRPSPPGTTNHYANTSSFLLRSLLLQHGFHDLYLCPLSAIHIGSEIEQIGCLPRPGCVEQVPHHRERTLVVLDHPFQEQSVELRAVRLTQSCHLLRRKHSRH